MNTQPIIQRLAALALLACITLATSLAQGQTIIRQETFENLTSASDDWYADSGVWQMGKPTSGPGKAYSGTNCAATVLGGNYRDNADSRLISPAFLVPPADQNPRLRFMSWMASYANDYGRVLIRTNGGAWRDLSGDLYGPGHAWNQVVLDLSAYANQTVQIAFLFHSDGDGAVADGWYVDEVTIVAGPIVPLVPNVVESFEAGWGDWSVERGGPWELGRPTSGPGSAHQGTNCVATTLAGDYPEGRYDANVYTNRLVSPAFVVPAASANPRLRFWHWYSFWAGPDSGEVQIKVGSGAWQMLARYEGNSSGVVWTRPSLDLSAYAGQSVRLGFFFSWRNADGDYWTDADKGWYVDEVLIQATYVGPTITLYPTNQTVIAGNPVTFVGGASGTDPLSYQWRFNGSPIPDATDTSYTIANAQTNHAGAYDLVVTNLYGAATSLPPAMLTVLVPATITSPPQSQTVALGSNATFSVTAIGTAPLSYQWQFNGANLPNGGRVSGATTPTLTITGVQVADDGLYTVVVSNLLRAVTSTPPARLTVPVQLPSITGLTMQPASPVVEGTNVTFCVTATGTAPLTYQWRRNGVSIVGATQACYDLANVTTAHAGAYSVAVSNAAGGVISGDLALAVLPDWRTNVVGATGDGSYTLVDGVFTVNGSGEDVEGTKDDFFFVHKPLNGDGQIVARLLGLVPADPNSEAGVMLRDGTNSGARHVFLPLNKEKRVSFRRRLTENDYAVQTINGGTNWTWLRLMRLGDTFVGHASTNGTDWALIYWTTLLNMPTNLEAGLAVTAHRNQAMATAQFDNVNTGPLTPLPGVWPESGPRLCLGGEGGGRTEFLRVGGFKVLVGGVVGERYAIKSSAVVDAPFASWLDMGTVTNTYGVVPFTDPQALTNGMRFYRATVVSP